MIRQVLLLFLVVALNVADVVTTIYGVCYLGSLPNIESKELWPFQDWVRDDSIRLENLRVKLLMPIVYASAFLFLQHYLRRIGFRRIDFGFIHRRIDLRKGLWILDLTLAGLIALFVVVVANNLIQIARALL